MPELASTFVKVQLTLAAAMLLVLKVAVRCRPRWSQVPITRRHRPPSVPRCP